MQGPPSHQVPCPHWDPLGAGTGLHSTSRYGRQGCRVLRNTPGPDRTRAAHRHTHATLGRQVQLCCWSLAHACTCVCRQMHTGLLTCSHVQMLTFGGGTLTHSCGCHLVPTCTEASPCHPCSLHAHVARIGAEGWWDHSWGLSSVLCAQPHSLETD